MKVSTLCTSLNGQILTVLLWHAISTIIDGVHDNQRAASLIVKNKIEDCDKAVEIYLTESELQALYEMQLTGKNDHIRDVFLIGCYTCQRVSDYNNLNEDHF